MGFGYIEKWEKLLSSKRVEESLALGPPGKDPNRSSFERDYDRVVFSAAFRRLAGKTQVHPFSEVDYVHNRLTHSLEVSSVAYSLASRAAKFLVRRGDIPEARVPDICWITQVAGLMHDIGNPPYGHAGESAIQDWGDGLSEKEVHDAPAWKDLRCYDGNAQAFRMAARPDLRSTTHFKFTCATLGALVKYTQKVSDYSAGVKKFSAFTSEDEIFRMVWDELGLVRDGLYIRHPLSFLSEAADDICYRITDFEDAVLMKILEEDSIKSILLPLTKGSGGENLQWVRSCAISTLIESSINAFISNYDKIMSGEFKTDLKSVLDDPCRSALGDLKSRYDTIFEHRRKVAAELGAFSQIKLLLDNFKEYIQDRSVHKTYDSLTTHSQLLVKMAWGQHFYDQNSDKDTNWWIHTVLDYLVGMTDSYINDLTLRIGR